MRLKTLGLIGLLTIGCTQTSKEANQLDKKFIGTFKQVSGGHYEILRLDKNHTLSSMYSSRIYGGEVFKETGNWRTSGDTLLIERKRHQTLATDRFPVNEKFLFRDDKLFELEINYKGELFETSFYFERQ